MLHHEHGIAPGINTPPSDDGLTASNSQPAKISYSYLPNFKALGRGLRAARLGPFIGTAFGLVAAHLMAGGAR